jgi:hypothetical protein
MSRQADHINFLVAGIRSVVPAPSVPHYSFRTSEANMIVNLLLTGLHTMHPKHVYQTQTIIFLTVTGLVQPIACHRSVLDGMSKLNRRTDDPGVTKHRNE